MSYCKSPFLVSTLWHFLWQSRLTSVSGKVPAVYCLLHPAVRLYIACCTRQCGLKHKRLVRSVRLQRSLDSPNRTWSQLQMSKTPVQGSDYQQCSSNNLHIHDGGVYLTITSGKHGRCERLVAPARSETAHPDISGFPGMKSSESLEALRSRLAKEWNVFVNPLDNTWTLYYRPPTGGLALEKWGIKSMKQPFSGLASDRIQKNDFGKPETSVALEVESGQRWKLAEDSGRGLPLTSVEYSSLCGQWFCYNGITMEVFHIDRQKAGQGYLHHPGKALTRQELAGYVASYTEMLGRTRLLPAHRPMGAGSAATTTKKPRKPRGPRCCKTCKTPGHDKRTCSKAKKALQGAN